MVTPPLSLAPSLVQTAQAFVGEQHYPAATLYVVATPIGNLGDISLRALHVLASVDAVACEDTRHTAALLRSYGLERPLLAVHEHNEAQAADGIVRRLAAGQRIAYVSDAGTPGISDPGSRLCHAVTEAGLRCMPLPGASSITALLSVAGLSLADQAPAFEFTGFLPAKGSARQAAVRRLAAQPHACVLLEAPHRIDALAQALAPLGDRWVTVGRELTKQFEDIATLPCAGLPGWLDASANRRRGEFTLVLHPQPQPPADASGLSAETMRVLGLLLQELPVKSAARLCADITGAPRNALYQAALGLKPD